MRHSSSSAPILTTPESHFIPGSLTDGGWALTQAREWMRRIEEEWKRD